VNYDTLRQYLNFNWTDFFICILVWHDVIQALSVQWQTNFVSYEELTSSPVLDLFFSRPY